jgi:short-subunit dehydrogenase
MRTLRDKRVLITGGGQGIGFAIARQFARAGALLTLTDINEEQLAEARETLIEDGAECNVFRMDVTDYEALGPLREEILAATGGLELLVNNAGIVQGGEFLKVPLKRHIKTLQVNTEAVMAVTHTFLGDVLEADEGHLVNIASASGFIGLPWGSSYASSKWGAIGFSESIRLELKRLGHRHVGVTTVCPSYVSTGMFEGVRQPIMTPFLTAEKLAKKIEKAVRKNDPFVLEPAMVKIMPFLKASLPTGASDTILDVFGASTSMKSWKGH